MKLDIKDIPDRKGNRYPARISVSLTDESRSKLEELKRRGKDTAELVRMLIDDFLKDVDFKDAG